MSNITSTGSNTVESAEIVGFRDINIDQYSADGLDQTSVSGRINILTSSTAPGGVSLTHVYLRNVVDSGISISNLLPRSLVNVCDVVVIVTM